MEEAKTAKIKSFSSRTSNSDVSAKASASYPFIFASPAIDAGVRVFEIDPVAGETQAVDCTIEVQHDRFPSYELCVNGSVFRILDAYEAGETGPGANLIAFEPDSVLAQVRAMLNQQLRLRIRPGYAEILTLKNETEEKEDKEFNELISAIFTSISELANDIIKDADVRKKYITEAKNLQREILERVQNGEWTKKRAMTEAFRLRQVLRTLHQTKLSTLGRGWSQEIHKELRSQVKINKISIELYKRPFNKLNESERSYVYVKLIKGAGRANENVSKWVKGLSDAAKAFIILSWALTIYAIMTADDPVLEAGAQIAGMAGAEVGALLASSAVALLELPLVAVAILAFAGAIIFSLLFKKVYDWLVYPDSENPESSEVPISGSPRLS